MISRNIFYIILILISFFLGCATEERKTVGNIIEGDFNGDKFDETVSVNLIKKNKDSTNEYLIVFSDLTIRKIGLKNKCQKIQLINEGDLNNDNADDISISFEKNLAVPISNMQTMSFNNNKWNSIIKHFSIYPGMDTLSSNELQKIVFKKGNNILYHTYGESFKFKNNIIPIDTNRVLKIIKIK